jgi:hypothetical protein
MQAAPHANDGGKARLEMEVAGAFGFGGGDERVQVHEFPFIPLSGISSCLMDEDKPRQSRGKGKF